MRSHVKRCRQKPRRHAMFFAFSELVTAMAPKRAEASQLALSALRDVLRRGSFSPGARLAAAEIAENLHLSPTPVREALSRLAGEGLLEDHPGQGYFVPTLTGPDIALAARAASLKI